MKRIFIWITLATAPVAGALAQPVAEGDIWKLNLPPAQQSCTVPYRQDADGTARPLVPIQLNHGAYTVNTMALVDSGADRVVFPLAYAGRLGIDLSRLEPSETSGVGNDHILTYHATVDLTISFCGRDYQYPSQVSFVASDSSLLGQAGFFDHFQVAFDRAKRELEIRSKDIQPRVAPSQPLNATPDSPGLAETLSWLREKIPLAIVNFTYARDSNDPVEEASSIRGTAWELDSCSAAIGETVFNTYVSPRLGQFQGWSKFRFTLRLGESRRVLLGLWIIVPFR
jgi:hypothetical protein